VAQCFLLKNKIKLMEKQPTDRDVIFFNDDGTIPNSRFPLTIYRQSFDKIGDEGADWLEKKFSSNGWTNSWRWGVYDFHHYHSNTHEVLGVYSGSATIKFGGENGEDVRLGAGDIVIIPAGVGHKCITHSGDFMVVGAYPGGVEPDIKKGIEGEREEAINSIATVPIPGSDPLLGKDGLVHSWKDESINPLFIDPKSQNT
jgi:uncharacterized protein YjlB